METITSYEKLKGLIENSHMVMIYFGSKACSVCNSMKPKVEKMIKRYPAIKALTVEKECNNCNYNKFWFFCFVTE
jgi:thioredoxin-related protein